MNFIKKWWYEQFGEWEVMKQAHGKITQCTPNGEMSIPGIIKIEENVKTGTKRAYVKEPDGTRYHVDVEYAEHKLNF